MEPRFVLFGAGWGALVGWVCAVVVALLAVTMEPGSAGWLAATSLVVIYPLVLGVPIGAASGAASGLVAAALVGRRTALRSVMFRVAARMRSSSRGSFDVCAMWRSATQSDGMV